MCETLPQLVSTTVSANRDRAKEHLDPSEHRERLSEYPVRAYGPGPQRPLVDVHLEVRAERSLRRNRQEEDIGEHTVRALEEFSATVCVSEYEATQCEHDSCGLKGGVRIQFIAWRKTW